MADTTTSTVKKKVATYSLHETTIKALQKEARRLAAERDKAVSASSLVDTLVQKYIINKRKGKK